MPNETPPITKQDPTFNVRELIGDAVDRIDDLRKAEVMRIDEKIDANNSKYQIQFNSAREAVGIASTAQEKLVAQALEGTKEAITKNDINTDKRFDLLSEKIDGIADTMSKNTGAQGIYVTHTDLSNEMSKLRGDFETMLRPVITYMNTQTGKSGGVDSSWTKLVTIIGITATVITLLIKFAV